MTHVAVQSAWLRKTDRQLGWAGAVGGVSGDRRRLGHISKQDNSWLRFLLVGGSSHGAHGPDWRRQFLNLTIRRERRIAKLAMARKLAVRLY